jgi:hypothetical protein
MGKGKKGKHHSKKKKAPRKMENGRRWYDVYSIINLATAILNLARTFFS